MLTFVFIQFCCSRSQPTWINSHPVNKQILWKGVKFRRVYFSSLSDAGFIAAMWTNYICPPKECRYKTKSVATIKCDNFVFSLAFPRNLAWLTSDSISVCGCLLFLFIMKRPTKVTFTNPWLSKHLSCGLQSVECLSEFWPTLFTMSQLIILFL